MLRSSNPILSKQDAFTPAARNQNQYNQYGQPVRVSRPNVQDPQANPYAQQYGAGSAAAGLGPGQAPAQAPRGG